MENIMINEELQRTKEEDEITLERIIDNKKFCEEENKKWNRGVEMVFYPMRYTEMVHSPRHISEHTSINKKLDEIRLKQRILQR